MRKISILFFLAIILCCGCSDNMDFISDVSQEVAADDQQAGDYYYYSNGEKHQLKLNTEYVFVSSSNEQLLNPLQLLRSYKMSGSKNDNVGAVVTRAVSLGRQWSEIELQEGISEMQYKESLNQLRQMNKEIVVSPYFKTSTSKKIGLSNYFYVKLKELKDSIKLKEMAIETKAKVIGPDSYMPLWYVVSVTPESRKNALEMANSYYESKKFQYAEPDFMEDNLISWEPNDPYLNQQWGIVNYNLSLAWNISKGDGVRIAILDQGILSTHPEFTGKIIASYDTESNMAPSKLLGDHGTMCAGVAAAKGNNNIGITGVAPNAMLLDISNSMDASPLSRMKRADGIMMAWRLGADVISNSWGSSIQYTQINEAINSATSNGRNGKGCVVVFSSGNDNRESVGYPSSLYNVISVGAIESNNKRASYSNYGGQLDVVAPGSSIYTTNYLGGYEYANGTSFACPYVAGVAALILSLKPELKGYEVMELINKSCQKLSSYSFVNNNSYSDGSWNQEVGYGLVDAYEALDMIVNPRPTLKPLRLTVWNNSNITHFIQCRLLDETGKLVWENGQRLEARTYWDEEISIYPGIYTMEADAFDAIRSYSSTFELINEGDFYIDFEGKVWDSGSGYVESY